MMSKKDYELIAGVLKKHQVVNDELIAELCLLLKNDNDRFDSEKFKKAVKG